MDCQCSVTVGGTLHSPRSTASQRFMRPIPSTAGDLAGACSWMGGDRLTDHFGRPLVNRSRAFSSRISGSRLLSQATVPTPCKNRATVSETAPSSEDLFLSAWDGPAHFPLTLFLETDSAAYVTLKTNLGEVGYAILSGLSQARARTGDRHHRCDAAGATPSAES